MNRTIAPPIIDAVDFDIKLKPYQKFVLDNGVPVYAINAGAQDVLKMELVFNAGNVFETKTAVASATNYLLKNGTSNMSAFQINEQFDYYGAHCDRRCYNETAIISFHTLNKHLEKLLPVLQDMITNAVFAEEELNIYKQNSKQALSVNLKKCDFVATRLIDEYLFGRQHPYGKYTTPQDVDALTSDDVKNFYKQHYVNGNCVIFVAGKLPANIQELLNEQFGKLSLSAIKTSANNIITTPALNKKYRISNDETGVQGAIRIARNFPNRHHPDFMKVMVLNTLFGGYFGSRLMANIREDKGYTYGIHSYLQNNIQESAWMISTEAGKDVCEATIEEVYKEMNLLQQELIGDDELLLVRNYMIGSILGDLDGPFQIMGRWKSILLNNLTEQYFYDSINTIKKISAVELQELAKKYLNPNDFYELIVI